jgi:hypothetical protein
LAHIAALRAEHSSEELRANDVGVSGATALADPAASSVELDSSATNDVMSSSDSVVRCSAGASRPALPYLPFSSISPL